MSLQNKYNDDYLGYISIAALIIFSSITYDLYGEHGQAFLLKLDTPIH